VVKLYLDVNEGASLVPCPRCHSPLLLGFERRGRLFVGYGRGVYLQPGLPALLVCCNYECDHQEPVQIAATPADAVVFSAMHAAGLYKLHVRSWDTTLDELGEQIRDLQDLHRRTGREKLLCAIKALKEEFDYVRHSIRSTLAEASQNGRPVSLMGGAALNLAGRVITTTMRGALLECDDGETRLVDAGELCSVAWAYEPPEEPSRFDFGYGSRLPRGAWAIHTPRHCVEIAGHTFNLDNTTNYGICAVHTNDPEVAAELNLWCIYRDRYVGEFPAALVERHFLRLQYCWVQGHRLRLEAYSRVPDLVLLETHDMATAQALQMHRETMYCIGARQRLSWWRHFTWREIDRVEEIRVPLPLPRARHRRAR